MELAQERVIFEQEKRIYESATLTFTGVEGFDVYNCSIPFQWKDGKRYLFGRVERRGEWARSRVRLFEEVGQDAWRAIPEAVISQLEDPYIAHIGQELVLGGVHVQYDRGHIATYFSYFYKGTELDNLYYFTTGPNYMKDIRLVPLADGKIGVFSRPRGEDILKKYGSESVVGFAIMDKLEDLSADIVQNAPIVDGLFGPGEWGGCNQCYLLESGKIGVIGHQCYKEPVDGVEKQVYLNISFVFDPQTRCVEDKKIIGTRTCYPQGPAKIPELTDCCFTSGMVVRPDGKVDLYSGLGDTQEGRIVIDNPFAGYGAVVSEGTYLQSV